MATSAKTEKKVTNSLQENTKVCGVVIEKRFARVGHLNRTQTVAANKHFLLIVVEKASKLQRDPFCAKYRRIYVVS